MLKVEPHPLCWGQGQDADLHGFTLGRERRAGLACGRPHFAAPAPLGCPGVWSRAAACGLLAQALRPLSKNADKQSQKRSPFLLGGSHNGKRNNGELCQRYSGAPVGAGRSPVSAVRAGTGFPGARLPSSCPPRPGDEGLAPRSCSRPCAVILVCVSILGSWGTRQTLRSLYRVLSTKLGPSGPREGRGLRSTEPDR